MLNQVQIIKHGPSSINHDSIFIGNMSFSSWSPTLLITGGTGYIGAHTTISMLNKGYSVVLIDNFANSTYPTLESIALAANLSPTSDAHHWISLRHNCSLFFVFGDVRSPEDLDRAFQASKPMIAGVIHFAGLKSVEESIRKPLAYWDVNVSGSISLLKAMVEHQCKVLVFSSTAAAYGSTRKIPIREDTPLNPISPYAQTKVHVERFLGSIATAEDGWRIAILRYFNPIGAHSSGMVGESSIISPTNIFPLICQVANGEKSQIIVNGSDWPTLDGSAIRDFIHVMDIAEGHCQAIDLLLTADQTLLHLNLGSGTGHSVLELIKCFEQTTGMTIPYRIGPRREGDIAISLADPSKAEAVLGWKATRTLADMCRDGWRWSAKQQWKSIQ